MVRVEEKLHSVDNHVKGIDKKLDKFIDTADNKYATNERVDSIKDHFEEINKKQDTKLASLTKTILKLSKDVAIILGILYLFFKGNGGLP